MPDARETARAVAAALIDGLCPHYSLCNQNDCVDCIATALQAAVTAERQSIAALADDLGQDIERQGRSGDAVKAALMKGGAAAYRSFAETIRGLDAIRRG